MESLFHRTYGERDNQPLVILHGLFGSGSNWVAHAKALTEHFFVVLPDLRNHGRSPHAGSMTYMDMAEDVAALLDDLQLDEVHLLGHSMGGKTAMFLGLEQPERIQKLVVLDIAPVGYHDRFGKMISQLLALDMSGLETREAVELALRSIIPDMAIRQFMMTNLSRQRDGFSWRVNMPVIADDLADIMAFDEPPLAMPWHGPALFLYGEQSDYVLPEYHEAIYSCFPDAELQVVRDAGHWVQADQPEAFRAQLTAWLA